MVPPTSLTWNLSQGFLFVFYCQESTLYVQNIVYISVVYLFTFSFISSVLYVYFCRLIYIYIYMPFLWVNPLFFVFCSKCQTKQNLNQSLMNQKTSDVWSEVFSDFMNYRCFDGGNGMLLALFIIAVLHRRYMDDVLSWRHLGRFNQNLF